MYIYIYIHILCISHVSPCSLATQRSLAATSFCRSPALLPRPSRSAAASRLSVCAPTAWEFQGIFVFSVCFFFGFCLFCSFFFRCFLFCSAFFSFSCSLLRFFSNRFLVFCCLFFLNGIVNHLWDFHSIQIWNFTKRSELKVGFVVDVDVIFTRIQIKARCL